MFIALVSFILIILNTYFKRNKFLYVLLFLWMWTIMAFTTEIADESIYISRYNNPELWLNRTELLYSLIMGISRKAGLDFTGYKAVITFIQLLLIFGTIWNLARFPNWVACLYLIYPFSLNVAQMRNALAVSIFIFSLNFLVEDVNQRRTTGLSFSLNDLKYTFCIILASFIHTASLCWIILLFAKKLNLKMNVALMLIVNFVVIFLFSPKMIIKLLNCFGAGNRIVAYFSDAYQDSSWRHWGVPLLQVLFYAAVTLFMCFYILVNGSKFNNQGQVLFLAKANIVILCIVGVIIRYTGEMTRIQEGVTVLNLIGITNSLNTSSFKKNRMSKFQACIFCLLFLFIFGIAIIALGLYLIPTVINPILNKNALWNTLF